MAKKSVIKSLANGYFTKISILANFMRHLVHTLIFFGFSVYAQVDSFPYFANHTDDITTIIFSPTSHYVVTGSWDQTIVIQKNDSVGSVAQRIEGYKGAVNSIAFSRDGYRMIAGGQDGNLNFYEFNDSFFQVATLDTSLTIAQGQINRLIFGPGMRTVFSAGYDGRFLTYDLAKEKVIPLNGKHPISAAAVAIDRMSYFIANEESADINQFDIFGKTINTFSGHTSDITDLMVTVDRKYLISSSKDKTVRIWDIANAKEETKFEEHNWEVTDIDMDPFGQFLVTGGLDGKVNLYNIKERKKLKTIILQNHKINAVALSPDNTSIAAAAQPNGETNTAGYFILPTNLAARKVSSPPRFVVKKTKEATNKIETKNYKIEQSTETRGPAYNTPQKKHFKPKKDERIIEKTEQIEVRIEN